MCTVHAVALVALLCGVCPGVAAALQEEPQRDASAQALIDVALAQGEGKAGESGRRTAKARDRSPSGPAGEAPLPEGGRELFAAVLATPLFEHVAVGPFDLYACKADGLRKAADARKLLKRAGDGLKPLADLLAREFPPPAKQGALMTGRRFSIVFASSRPGGKEPAFEQLVALLDRCEDGAFSGYKPDLPIWTASKRAAESVTTWEVALFNLGHPALGEYDQAWLGHGLGYSMCVMLGSRMLYRGAFGPVPPWLLQGLADELDIAAHGQAWVAGGESSSWSSATAGWRNAGWEGFVPEGAQPPPPVFGPPPGQRTRRFESTVSADTWLDRGNSTTRHWSELAADLDSEQPVSLAAMAGTQSFTPRDRAWSRLMLHLLLDIARPDAPGAPGPRPGLLAALDRENRRARSGLLDGEPLPVIMARVLGTEAIAAQTAQPLGAFLEEIGRDDIASRLKELQAAALLAMHDHAAQADWLYTQTQYDDRARLALFNLIVEVESYRELREWEVLGARLDAAARAALAASKSYPREGKARTAVADAFRAALAAE